MVTMPASKIVNESEVVHWFEEGRTYAWMVEEYKRKYNIDTVPSLWGNFRRRRGLARRITRNDELIPWFVRAEHRQGYPVQMLRSEARRREGKELRPIEAQRLEGWLRGLERDNVVVHYDPDTEQGWWYIPREAQDFDIIRYPKRKTTPRKAAD
jgi:hypothetical protein